MRATVVGTSKSALVMEPTRVASVKRFESSRTAMTLERLRTT